MKSIRQNNEHPEKRKYPRKTYVTKASYQAIIKKKEEMPSKDAAQIQNISDGGVCLMLKRKFSPGAVLELKFDLPDTKRKSIKTLVEVVWQKKTEKGYLTGLKFGV